MARDLYEIARECAENVISTAQCAGYDIRANRALFFRGDVGNLADTITDWLQAHMKMEAEP
jgi:hypothetical protein